MPYIPSEKTAPPAQDRLLLDSVVEALAGSLADTHEDSHSYSEALCRAFLNVDLAIKRRMEGNSLPDKNSTLGNKIMDSASVYKYDGAHLGLLNYSLTRLIQRVPQLKVERNKWKDEMLEYKRRVNVAYEAAQIIKSGDCYDTPNYTRLIPVQNATGELIGRLEVMRKRDANTLTVDELAMCLAAHVAERSPS